MDNMLVHDAIHPQMRSLDLTRTCIVVPQSSAFGSMKKLLQIQELNSALMKVGITPFLGRISLAAAVFD
jgi:hypothetical protein